MLRQEELDVVAPILPVEPNPDVVTECLCWPGVKAVYCEKPMAASLEDSDRMVAAAEEHGVAFAAGDAYRNMPQHWKVRALIDSGALGEVRSLNLYQAQSEISGGGCQGLSVLRLFANDAPVERVTGWCSGDPWDDGDQNMGGVVRFANGIDGFIHNQKGNFDGIEVICEKGRYKTSWSHGQLWRGGFGEPEVEDTAFFEQFGEDWIQPSGTRQKHGIESLVAAIDTGGEPRCSGANMRAVLEIAIGLRESHRRGFASVQLPLEDRTLKIIPAMSRYLNKKPQLGEEVYSAAIQDSAGRPIGGAETRAAKL